MHESGWVEVVRWIQNLKKIMKAHLSGGFDWRNNYTFVVGANEGDNGVGQGYYGWSSKESTRTIIGLHMHEQA